VCQTETDAGDRLTSGERERMKALERENRELRKANEIPKGRLGVFRQGARPDPTEVSAFIDAHRERFGVEPHLPHDRRVGVGLLPARHG